MTKFLTAIVVLFMVTSVSGQDQSVYEKKQFKIGGDVLPYRILYPINYNPNKKYPLIVILHGAGERGNDNESQLIHGSKLFAADSNRKKFPAIVVFPQCPKNDSWGRLTRDSNKKDSLGGLVFQSDQKISKPLELVSKLLDSLVAAKRIDRKKIYVGGLSMGGMGTFEILWRKPNFFAAALPICGGGDPAKATVYGRKFPIWIFHGDNDQAVTVGNSRRMLNALKAAGAKVRYSEYAGVGHNSWDNAFAEPDLLKWLFAQKR